MKAKKRIYGASRDSYKLLLWLYGRLIIEINLGAITDYISLEDERFMRLFVSYLVSMDRFKYNIFPIIPMLCLVPRIFEGKKIEKK